MRRIYGDELKKIQVEILNVVANFCAKNNINYWIDCGTLLGAVRHKGYIPWDDDIDVGMLRGDYNKFMELFNKGNDRYRFYCIEISPEFYLPHGKVCDTSTVLYEPDEQGNKLAVNIDIFVYDNAPDDDEVVEKLFDERDLLRKRYQIRTEHGIPKGNILKKILKYGRRYIYRILFRTATVEKMVKNSRKFENQETKRVGNFTSFSRTMCHKRVFDSFVDIEFEGKYYKAPIGYDEWLKAFYGDYMELPPIEKRKSHHSFVAYGE